MTDWLKRYHVCITAIVGVAEDVLFVDISDSTFEIKAEEIIYLF